MKSLEKEYEVNRYDIKTSEKKILKKYGDVIKKHENYDIRVEEDSITNGLINIKEITLQKIFSFIEDTIPEEHVLFLYLCKKKNKPQSVSVPTESGLNDSSIINIPSNRGIGELKINKKEDEKENIQIKKNKAKTDLLFSIVFFIVGLLFLIHLLIFTFSDNVSNQYNYFIFLSSLQYAFIFSVVEEWLYCF